MYTSLYSTCIMIIHSINITYNFTGLIVASLLLIINRVQYQMTSSLDLRNLGEPLNRHHLKHQKLLFVIAKCYENIQE